MIQTSDGGFAMAGYTGVGSAGVDGAGDGWLVKTDSAGNMQWNRTFENANFFSLIQTTDGGYVLAGNVWSVSSVSGYTTQTALLVKTDSSGNTEWNQTYSMGNVLSVVQTPEGGYALAAVGASGPDNVTAWLVKTDSSGNVEWNQTYGGTGNNILNSVIETSDGGYALGGWTDSYGTCGNSLWLVKTNSAGSLEWNQTYGGQGDNLAASVIQTSDGGYVLAGYSTPALGSESEMTFYPLLVKYDSSGNFQWNVTYGNLCDGSLYSVTQTTDGGYAAAGYTNSSGIGGNYGLLIKTDAEGDPVIPELSFDARASSKNVLGQDYGLNMTVTAADLSDYAETFNITVYANTTCVASQDIAFSSGNSTTVTFTWDTTGFAYGDYTISAYAVPVTNETNTASTNCVGGNVVVTIPGDVNGDFKVDMKDIAIVARAFGSTAGSSNWNPNCDINGDGTVNMRDIALAARHFGQHYP
jgi:hypothetical protein